MYTLSDQHLALLSLDLSPGPPLVDDLVCAAQKCRQTRNALHAKKLHSHIHLHGLEALDTLGNFLVPMFVDCRGLPNAHQVFLKLDCPNEHSWNFLVHGYVEANKLGHALELFKKMQEDCIHANMYTCQTLLKACGTIKCVGKGQEVHFEIAKEGFDTDTFVGSTLLAMYAKCGFLMEAQDIFDELEDRDVVAWTALIAGYAEQDCSEEVLNCLEKMQTEGVSIDSVTLVCSLKGCASIGAIERGMEIHAKAVKEGYEEDLLVSSTLVDMYAKCRYLAEAQVVFNELSDRNLVSWNTLLGGYFEHGLHKEVVDCIRKMKADGVSPDGTTFTSSVRSCGRLGTIDRGQEMHADVVKAGLESDPILGSTLMDMYGDCGLLMEAQAMFDTLQVHDVVAWTSLLTVYADHGLYEEVWTLYEQMQLQRVSPNALTLLCIVRACGSMCILDRGQCMHHEITKKGFEMNPLVASSLLDMYSKFGLLPEAYGIFGCLPSQDVVMWSSIILGYASQGQSKVVFQMFDRMRDKGIRPGEAAFLAVLTVCSHAGFLEEGQWFFRMMIDDYDITPTVEHHNCAADLLGRSGQLVEAVAVMLSIPSQPNFATWTTMLMACQKCANVNLGLQAFSNALRLKENQDATFVLMSNIYAQECSF